MTHNKHISLNKLWVQKQYEFFKSANNEYNYKDTQYDNILSMADGDRASYIFHTAELLDQYWAHMFEIFIYNSPKELPIFLLNPHEWFFIAKKESEEDIFRLLDNDNRLILQTGFIDTQLDRLVLKNVFNKWKHQYFINNKIKRRFNYYLNIVGDFLIEVYLDEDVSQKIEKFYQENVELNQVKVEEFKKIVHQKGKNRLVISRNKFKANNLRKKLSKPFVVKPPFRI